jgi:hypothetical protein
MPERKIVERKIDQQQIPYFHKAEIKPVKENRAIVD